MYRKMLGTLALAGTLIANPLFAVGFFQNMVVKATNTSNAPLKSTTTNTNNFVDFSGSWQGRCEGDNQFTTIIIKNTAKTFTISGTEYISPVELRIGALESLSSTYENVSFFTHLLLEWSEDNSKLLMNGSFAHYAALPSPEIETAFGDMRSTLSLVSDKLVMEFNTHYSSGESETKVCTYSKL